MRVWEWCWCVCGGHPHSVGQGTLGWTLVYWVGNDDCALTVSLTAVISDGNVRSCTIYERLMLACAREGGWKRSTHPTGPLLYIVCCKGELVRYGTVSRIAYSSWLHGIAVMHCKCGFRFMAAKRDHGLRLPVVPYQYVQTRCNRRHCQLATATLWAANAASLDWYYAVTAIYLF